MPPLPESPKAPKELTELQNWFSEAVVAQNKSSASFEPDRFINKSARLKADERLDIYMGDYWPRVLESLAEDFPILYSLWGEGTFDTYMKDYLKQFPSTSFTLFHLGKNLPTYLNETYKQDNKELVMDIVSLEWAGMHAYMAQDGDTFDSSKLDTDQASKLSSTSLDFHPSVTLLHMDHPILFLEKGDDFPSKEKQFGIVYREGTSVKEKELNTVQFQLLSSLKSKASLVDTLDLLSKSLNSNDLKILESNVTIWFQEAVQSGWFLHPKF
jgi:hypothetical protein